MRELARASADESVESLLAKAAEIRAPAQRIAFLEALIVTIGEKDPWRAVGLAEGLPPSPFKGPLTALALQALARKDPKAALERVAESMTGIDRHNATISIAEAWAAKDPKAAFAYALATENPALQSNLLETTIGMWGSMDPTAALAAASSLKNEQRNLCQRAIVGNWAQTDPAAALRWSEEFYTTSSDRDPLVIGMANAAASDPALTVETLVRVNNTELTREVAPIIAQQWVMRDPSQAWSFATGLSDEPARAHTIEQTVNAWATFDPQAAAKAVELLPAGSVDRRMAMQGLALGLAGNMQQEVKPETLFSNPAAAREMGNALQGPEVSAPEP